MGKPLKYKLGDKLKEFTIININENCNPLSYEVKCKCGFIRPCKGNKLKRLTTCSNCSRKSESESHIGKKINSFTVLESTIYKGVRCLKVQCDCGRISHSKMWHLKKTLRCTRCRNGFYPGKVMDGITLLEYLGDRKYKIKCHCGKIYQEIPRKYKGKYSDCGCSIKNRYLNESISKYIGTRWGHLKVTRFLRNENGHNIFELRCKCGNKVEKLAGHFPRANSCGCLKKEMAPRADKKGNARFKNYEIISMRELHSSGLYDVIVLAEMFDCSPHYIGRIIKRSIWKSI